MTIRGLLLAISILAPVSAWAQPVSGPYIGAAAGMNLLSSLDGHADTVSTGRSFGPSSVSTSGSAAPDAGWAALGSLGYGFGNGLRTELEGNWRSNHFSTANGLFGAHSSSGHQSGHVEKYGIMANALYDLPLDLGWLHPYIGGGLGVQWEEGRFDTTSVVTVPGPVGLPFPGATPTPTSRTATTHSSMTLGDPEARFAYQAIAGFSIPLPLPGLQATAEYRYLGIAGEQRHTTVTTSPNVLTNVTGARTATTTTRRVSEGGNHALLIGLRYTFGG